MKFTNIILFTIIGFLVGLLASVLSTYNVWLDMRVHARHILLVFIIIGFLMGLKFKAKFFYFFVAEFFLIIFCFLGKFDTIYCNFRETFLPNLSLSIVKPIFNIKIIFFNVIAVILFYLERDGKHSKKTTNL